MQGVENYRPTLAKGLVAGFNSCNIDRQNFDVGIGFHEGSDFKLTSLGVLIYFQQTLQVNNFSIRPHQILFRYNLVVFREEKRDVHVPNPSLKRVCADVTQVKFVLSNRQLQVGAVT